MKIILTVEGGIIQHICSDGTVDVIIVDRDTEGCPPSDFFEDGYGERSFVSKQTYTAQADDNFDSLWKKYTAGAKQLCMDYSK